VTTHSRVSDKFDRWEFYTYVSERDEWYLLGRSRHIATVFVPKRGFASPADEAVFRCLVRAHAQASLLASPAIDDPTGQPPPVPPD